MSGKQSTILIVDDEPINLRILIDLLEDDHEVLIAKNGQQAIDIVKSTCNIDLILLDIVMPGMDGYEVCSKLKRDPKTVNIPVIFATAMNEISDEEKGLRVGAIDYISKPYRLPIVKMRVRNHLELKRRGDLLEALATLDGLIGIPNRRRFDQFLEQEWCRAMRQQQWISAILIDVDHFKLYNDHYGHAVGDDCLKSVGRTLAETLGRSSDLVARYGGEEFVCVLPETQLEAAVLIAEKIKQAINALMIPHEASPVCDHVTVSQGIASVMPAMGSDPSSLIHEADKKLYLAKESGRNGFAS